MNTSSIIEAVAKQKVQQQIMSSNVRPWTPPSSLVIYRRNYIGSSCTRSTNSEAFKAQIWKLLMKHIVLTLWAASIILLHRRPALRSWAPVLGSYISYIACIHLHTSVVKYLLFMVKVLETSQGCINTLLLTSKISVFKVQESRSIRRSEARKLSYVKVHLPFNRSLYRRSPIVNWPIK